MAQISSIQLNDFECIQFRHESWFYYYNSDCCFSTQWKIHSHFANWRVCINFPWNSGFQRFIYTHRIWLFHLLFDCEWREFYFIITSNVICVVIVIRLSFIALECFRLFYCRVCVCASGSYLVFALFRFQLNEIKWRACLFTYKKRTYHLLAVPQYTASNWAKLFLRCVCVCV